MRKFRLLPVIMVSIALMMGITGCESTTQKPAKEETKKEETKEEETKQPETSKDTDSKSAETTEKKDATDTTDITEEKDSEAEKKEDTAEKAEDTTKETESEKSQEEQLTLYLPNENADGWNVTKNQIEQVTPDIIIGQLVGAGAIPDSVTVVSFGEDQGENGLILKLDLSSNFAEGLLNMGTAGEYLTMGAVVNSFLDTYQADGIEITAGGTVIETGHTSFEGVLNHFDSNESQ
ncbi:hypothetical protein ACEG19_01520 [Blautia stercoris]|uniref:hypothetical protein n=1 Tax=Blautia stercoris TaxID=871664 RepID=UPI00355B30B2